MPARLTEDLIVEILSRLPIKSLHRFICVCRRWRHLISYSGDRRRLPQTLAGFFYIGPECSPLTRFCPLRFANIFGSRQPLFNNLLTTFLPFQGRIIVLDCCNGLLLCRWRDVSPQEHYIVCNPATEKWVALPDSSQNGEVSIVRLGFDPTVSPHFYVFELLEGDITGPTLGVEVYSSETGRWILKEEGWDLDIEIENCVQATVFLNGRSYFQTYTHGLNYSSLSTVDTKGGTWTNFPIPTGKDGGLVQLSQGRLHYACLQKDDDGLYQLKVYVLQDYDSQEWILKHSVGCSHLFGEVDIASAFSEWVALHPECNLLFFILGDGTFMCYNMNLHQVEVICDLVGEAPYLPYVPLYSELPALQM